MDIKILDMQRLKYISKQCRAFLIIHPKPFCCHILFLCQETRKDSYLKRQLDVGQMHKSVMCCSASAVFYYCKKVLGKKSHLTVSFKSYFYPDNHSKQV